MNHRKNLRSSKVGFHSLSMVLAAASSLFGQVTVQGLSLAPGWNALYLEVDPIESSSQALIQTSGDRIESIWTYDNRFGGERAFTPTEFDPAMDPPPVRVKNRWQVFHPSHPAASNLLHLRGDRAYLIKVKDDMAPFSLEIRGRPIPSDPWWVPNDYSLAGFRISPSLGPGQGPTFAQYFSGSPVHLSSGSRIYSMDAAGNLVGPLDKTTTRIGRGRAYWVYTAGASSYKGPFELRGVPREGLDFGKELVETTLELRNTESIATTLTLRVKRTIAETPPGFPAWAGDVWLQYFKVEGEVREWVDLDQRGVALTLPPDSTRSVRLQARRQGLPVATKRREGQVAPAGGGGVTEGACFQGEVEITTVSGVQESAGVCVEVPEFTGLWTGTVHLMFVRQLRRAPPSEGGGFDPEGGVPANFPDTTNGTDNAPELSFPLLVHVGRREGGHVVTLLRQVALLWRNGVEPNPGRYVLLTRAGLAAGLIEKLGLLGGTLRDGRRFSYLMTSPLFHKDFVLAGPSENFSGSGRWRAVIHIPKNDPLNPFIHRYQPDHGHPKVMRETGGIPATGGIEVKRTLTLEFSATDPNAGEIEVQGKVVRTPPRPEYGDTILGGRYREVIESLTYDPVVVEGTFELTRVVQEVEVLNDGLPIPYPP